MRRLLAAFAGVVLALSLATGVLAWGPISLSAECAPDEDTYAWTIDLPAGETDYNIEWSFAADFSTFTKVDFSTAGEHEFTTPRGGDVLYVRWSSDLDNTAQANANEELCAAVGTPTPTPEGTVNPGGSTPTPTPEDDVQGGNPTPAPEVPDTASTLGTSSPVPVIIFGLILLVSLGALLVANTRAAQNSK